MQFSGSASTVPGVATWKVALPNASSATQREDEQAFTLREPQTDDYLAARLWHF